MAYILVERPRQDSNLHQHPWLEVLYPLSYGGEGGLLACCVLVGRPPPCCRNYRHVSCHGSAHPMRLARRNHANALVSARFLPTVKA